MYIFYHNEKNKLILCNYILLSSAPTYLLIVEEDDGTASTMILDGMDKINAFFNQIVGEL